MRGLRPAAVLGVLALGACRSGPDVASYPGTDIPIFEEFRLHSARNVQKSGQHFRQGELEYTGEGDVRELYRRYSDAMAELGWTNMSADVHAERAVGRFRKDERFARVELRRGHDDGIFASIRVAVTPEPQVR